MSKMTVTADAKPMLNAYPDSVGGTLSDIIRWSCLVAAEPI